MKFKVRRAEDEVIVLILPHKETGEFSFVNLTKGHICPCTFSSVEDAIADMQHRLELGRILSYEEIPEVGYWVDDACSVCNYGVMPWNHTAYCPRCGSPMTEVQDG